MAYTYIVGARGEQLGKAPMITYYFSVLSPAWEDEDVPGIAGNFHQWVQPTVHRWTRARASEGAARRRICWKSRIILTGRRIIVSASFKFCGFCLVDSKLAVTVVWGHQEKEIKVHAGCSRKNNMQRSLLCPFSSHVDCLPVFKVKTTVKTIK